MITKSINVEAAKATTSSIWGGISVTLDDISINQLLAEFPVQEVLEALKDNDHFTDMVDYVTKELEEDE